MNVSPHWYCNTGRTGVGICHRLHLCAFYASCWCSMSPTLKVGWALIFLFNIGPCTISKLHRSARCLILGPYGTIVRQVPSSLVLLHLFSFKIRFALLCKFALNYCRPSIEASYKRNRILYLRWSRSQEPGALRHRSSHSLGMDEQDWTYQALARIAHDLWSCGSICLYALIPGVSQVSRSKLYLEELGTPQLQDFHLGNSSV